MQFVPLEDGEKLARKSWHLIGDRDRPKVTLYYESGPQDYAPAACLIATAAGDFKDALLLFKFAISGDGWGEQNHIDQRCQAYRR